MAATCSMSFNTHGLAMREETIYGMGWEQKKALHLDEVFHNNVSVTNVV